MDLKFSSLTVLNNCVSITPMKNYNSCLTTRCSFLKKRNINVKESNGSSFIDFGLNLQPTIDLIEKPMGIMALIVGSPKPQTNCLSKNSSHRTWLTQNL